MCTYYSPLFLFPPHELLQVATCAREWDHAEIAFLDAIADECDQEQLEAFIASHKPDMLVALIGMESVSDDLACMDRIKAAFPELTCVVFGFYVTVLSELVLDRSRVDLILRGEPEVTLSKYLRAKAAGGPIDAIPGLAGRREDGSVFINETERIVDFDGLPFPDYTLIDVRRYEEGLLGGPCGAIFTMRGCPFHCSYCTTTFGHRLAMKTPETVVAEVKALARADVRVIRFLDDTFTLDKFRVIAICKGILEQDLAVRWVCLSRVDTLDEEMLTWMKRAGCVRIVMGVESYSPKVLEYLDKHADPAQCNTNIQLVRHAGIETLGFFLVGAPVETEHDFQQTLKGVLDSPLDLIAASVLTPYPGTPFFDKVRNDIVFSLIPYECRFKDESISLNAMKRERTLYMRFYLRPITVWCQLRRFLRFPLRSTRLLLMLLQYQTKQFRRHERPDLF